MIYNYISNMFLLKKSAKDGINEYHSNIFYCTSDKSTEIFEPIIEIDDYDIILNENFLVNRMTNNLKIIQQNSK